MGRGISCRSVRDVFLITHTIDASSAAGLCSRPRRLRLDNFFCNAADPAPADGNPDKHKRCRGAATAHCTHARNRTA